MKSTYRISRQSGWIQALSKLPTEVVDKSVRYSVFSVIKPCVVGLARGSSCKVKKIIAI